VFRVAYGGLVTPTQYPKGSLIHFQQIILRSTLCIRPPLPFTSSELTRPKTCCLPVLHRELLEKTRVRGVRVSCEGSNVTRGWADDLPLRLVNLS